MSQNLISQPKGEPITIHNNELNIPDFPIIPFIEGDGIGQDISPAMQKVINAAVSKAYDGAKKIDWLEIYCLLYTSPSPRDRQKSRMPSSA